jgi:N-acetylmuramoyl-L-alanine amidase
MRVLFGVGSVLAVLLATGCSGRPTASPAPSRTVPTRTSAATSAPASTGGSTPTAATSASRLPIPGRSSAVSSEPVSQPSTPLRPLTGDTVVLNPGHNGGNAADPAAINRQVPAGFGKYKACDTTGTETNAGYPEHAFNWDVSLRVSALLRARGVRVIMTRSSDTGVGPCVDERARIGNQAGVTAVVSLHADGAAASGHGFHVCEDSRQPAGPAVAASSHRLTVALHDALLRGSGLTVSSYLGSNGYFPRDDLAGLNLATVPATFLEIGNMRNAGDAALQTSAAGRQRIAEAVAAGILAWLGHP